ncbi:hypothetical protein ACOMHN_025942 [Nucella lapillus]
MGTGKGSRSGSGSSATSSSGSGSPPPIRTELRDNVGGGEEEGEEEPADRCPSHAPDPRVCEVSGAPSAVSSRPDTAPVTACPQPEQPHTAHDACCGSALMGRAPPTSPQRQPAPTAGPANRSAHSMSGGRDAHRPLQTSTDRGGFSQSVTPSGCSPVKTSNHHTPLSRCGSLSYHPTGPSNETQGPGGGSSHVVGRISPHPEEPGIPERGDAEPGSQAGPPDSEACGGRLLDHHSLVQEEKLVAATLASLDQSGDPSTIIKQDLRLIIQSRRKAEGKEELRVDFSSPPREELTEEEWHRALKRRGQNRRAAQRFRHKQRQMSSTLADRVRQLQAAHTELLSELQSLEAEKMGLMRLVRQHCHVCKDFDFKLHLQQALGYTLINSDPRKWPS